MKKIIALLLILVCTVSVVACKPEGPDYYKEFNDAVASSSPTSCNIIVRQTQTEATLNANLTVTFSADGSMAITGTHDVFLPIGSGNADEITETQPVSVTRDANGNYSDGGAFINNTPVVVANAFNFDATKMTAVFSDDANVVTATVAKENTKAVVGMEIASAVSLTVTKNDGKIISYTIEYADVAGAVYINCTCNY